MRVVIFDMDGTLIDSSKDITISINYVRERNHQLEPLSEEFVIKAINMQERNLPKLFYTTEDYKDDDRAVFEKHYAKQCVKNLYLYDGVLEVLQTLKNHGVKLSVATNAPTKFAKIMLKSLDVDSYFDMIVGADKVQIPKPNPMMLEFILEDYGFKKGEDLAWVVGDSLKDMESATNANLKSLFALWGFSPISSYKNKISSPKEIINIVL